MGALHLDEKNFEAEVLKSSLPVLVDFWAEAPVQCFFFDFSGGILPEQDCPCHFAVCIYDNFAMNSSHSEFRCIAFIFFPIMLAFFRGV